MNKKKITKWINLILAAVFLTYIMAPELSLAAQPQPGGTPNYFGPEPNYANSPSPMPDPANPGQYLQDPAVPGKLLNGIRKFVDSLPGLGPNNANDLGQYISIATPMTAPAGVPNDGDYYEIGLTDYSMQMHKDMPSTKLRGYKDLNPAPNPVYGDTNNHYLGPVIIAHKDKPVRIKFVNMLAAGSAGDLFLPVDTTVMGSGAGPDTGFSYQQNRATLHLHGGDTPWISDGTPHQWTVPFNDTAAHYQKGVSTRDVPDMPPAGQGAMTFFWPNSQSSRFMFYHDHSYGITRLNVYAGEAAGYLLVDPTEDNLINTGVIPNNGGGVYNYGIPLVVQEKTFVDAAKIASQDPTWNWGMTPGTPHTGDLWFPHVYMPNQNPNDPSGVNSLGRWDYGPWFFPAQQGVMNGPLTLPSGLQVPGVPDTSYTPEGYHDTPIVNGCAYPYLVVQPAAYRFRILNAANDRYFNLQLYRTENTQGSGAAATAVVTNGAVTSINVTNTGSGYASAPSIYIFGTSGAGAAATATISSFVSGLTLNAGGSNYTSAPAVSITGGGGSGAAATATINGSVSAITVTNSGNNYSSAPTVTITGGGGSGATATAVLGTMGMNRDRVVSITVNNGGSGYTSIPTVTITGGGGSGATATAAIKGPVSGITLTGGGSGYTFAPSVSFTGGGGSGATATARIIVGGVTAITITNPGNGYAANPMVQIGSTTEVKMVPAITTVGFPQTWPTDNRDGGVPDPALAGPSIIQIGSEGGLLPAPAVIAPQPITWDPATGQIANHSLWLGPAERADVIIDFSQVAPGTKLILYNDGPAPVPAIDPRWDYYTGATDQTIVGGAPSPLPGYGPNTRTIMQFIVDPAGTPAPAFDMAKLNAAFTSTVNPSTGALVPGAFAASQPAPIVPQSSYNSAYNANYADVFPRNTDATITFTPAGSATPVTMTMDSKGILEPFENMYGRGEAQQGVYSDVTQMVVNLGNPDPPTELFKDGQPQIWRVVHNGMDTHPIHFHLFNVQLIERVGWDGTVYPPDPEELGWKETVKMKAGQNTIVAFLPKRPPLPFAIPDSVRLLDPTSPPGKTWQTLDINANPVTITNALTNFGWEYVWHCHILGHEENDMMRTMVLQVTPADPSGLNAAASGRSVVLTWTNNASNATGFTIQRATDAGFTTGLATFSANAVTQNPQTYTDSTASPYTSYYYRVQAINVVGDNVNNFPTSTSASAWTAAAGPVVLGGPPAPATNLSVSAAGPHQANLSWSYAKGDYNQASGFRVEIDYTGTFTALGTVAGDVTACSDTAALPGIALKYRVISYNEWGDASASNTATITLPLPAPTNLSAAMTSAPPLGVTLAWTDNSLGTAGFTIQRSTSSSFLRSVSFSVGAGTTSYADTTVSKSITYYYRVRATLGSATTAWTNVASVKTAVPTVPTKFKASVSVAGSTILAALSWQENGSLCTFIIERATNSTFRGAIALPPVDSTQRSVVDSGLAPATKYYYRIKAVNGAGSSAWAIVIVTTPRI